MSHHQPTNAEVRARIMTIKDEKYRHAFMFQLVCCARISEVCGKYAPRGTDFLEMEFDGEPAVMFILKTAKRKGRLRPCAIPLNPDYEPWAQPLLDYFKKAGDDYPFMFNENPAHSVRYAQWKAQQTFDEMMWPMVQYTKTVEILYDPDTPVISTRYGETGYEEYLVEVEGKRYWTYSKDIVKENVVVLERWKPMRSHALRKRRTLTLTLNHLFDGFDLAYYAGWTETGKDSDIPPAAKAYLHMDLTSAEEVMIVLKMEAKRYFHKLCKSI